MKLLKALFITGFFVFLAGCAIPIKYNEYNGSKVAQRDYTYAVVALARANSSNMHPNMTKAAVELDARQAEFYGLKAFYEGDPRATMFLMQFYSYSSYGKRNYAYSKYFCNQSVKSYYYHHNTIALQRKHLGVEYQNLWVRKELDRELREKSGMKAYKYRRCTNFYGNTARMPIVKMYKNGYKIYSAPPKYFTFATKTETIFWILKHTDLTTPLGWNINGYRVVGVNPTTRHLVRDSNWDAP